MRFRSDEQRRAVFSHLRQGAGIRSRREIANQGRGINVFRGALLGAYGGGLAIVALYKGSLKGAIAATKLTNKYYHVHPLKVMRAAQKLHPNLKGATRILRNEKDIGKNVFGSLSLEKVVQHTKDTNILNEVTKFMGRSKRSNIIMASRKNPLGSSATLAHELGHLRPGSLGADFAKGTTLRRLKEELAADVAGYKIYRKAGGKPAPFIGSMVPAFGSYVASYTPFQVKTVATGAIIGGRAGSRFHKKYADPKKRSRKA